MEIENLFSKKKYLLFSGVDFQVNQCQTSGVYGPSKKDNLLFDDSDSDILRSLPGYSSVALPETNIIAPENRAKPKRKGLSSNHPFSGASC